MLATLRASSLQRTGWTLPRPCEPLERNVAYCIPNVQTVRSTFHPHSYNDGTPTEKHLAKRERQDCTTLAWPIPAPGWVTLKHDLAYIVSSTAVQNESACARATSQFGSAAGYTPRGSPPVHFQLFVEHSISRRVASVCRRTAPACPLSSTTTTTPHVPPPYDPSTCRVFQVWNLAGCSTKKTGIRRCTPSAQHLRFAAFTECCRAKEGIPTASHW